MSMKRTMEGREGDFVHIMQPNANNVLVSVLVHLCYAALWFQVMLGLRARLDQLDVIRARAQSTPSEMHVRGRRHLGRVRIYPSILCGLPTRMVPVSLCTRPWQARTRCKGDAMEDLEACVECAERAASGRPFAHAASPLKKFVSPGYGLPMQSPSSRAF